MVMRNRNLVGGYAFKRFAGRPEDTLVQAPLPAKVRLVLRSPHGADLPALVKNGEQVKAGQILARDEATGACVLATLSGRIEELKPAAWLGGKTKVATIAGDGTVEWAPLDGHSPDWRAASSEALRGRILRSGAAVLPARASHLVVQAVEDEAHNANPEVLEQVWGLQALVEGLAILLKALPGARLHLALNRRRRALAARVEQAAGKAGLPLQVYELDGKYPQAHRAILLPTLLGRSRGAGQHSAREAAVLDLQSLLHARDAVALGKPMLERVVALAGTGFARRPHLRARIGTPLGELARPYLASGPENRLVLNSLIAGTAVSVESPLPAEAGLLIAVPENKEGELLSFAIPGLASDSRSLTFAAGLLPLPKKPDTNLHGEHRACISCGFCEDVCPVRIMPNLLHRYVQKNLIDETLVRFQIFKCIDCNLCSYVCTSKIPLARLMREGKERLAKEGLQPREVGA
jgi:Na(+)-translocating NADH:ubiquinone oxidoreductase A subunit